MDNIREEKNKLRKEIKEKHKLLTEEYYKNASKSICDKVISRKAYMDAEVIFCFVGVDTEPDTREIIENALECGKTVLVPKCIDDKTMEAVRITDYDNCLEKGFYGLLEPVKGLQKVSREKIQYGIIPCVSCDSKGNRLGHGKGYYDRYLEGMNIPCSLLCFKEIMVEDHKIPTDKFDYPIDDVVTD
ncbi:MAG: 5-formyltetrahydrofolate cyclo-ligase [Hornefia sp.]|nr:5-formyltetrahydrofolate cyclo-ligase [Hornefia sp.]